MSNLKLDSSQKLVKLGLSPHEANVYQVLLEEGSQTSKEISNKAKILPNAVYRLIDSIQNKGFVVSLDTYPKKFQAIPPSIAIESFTEQQQKMLEELKLQSIQSLTKRKVKSPQTRIDIIVSRAEVFSNFVKHAAKAKDEILIISIGEPVPDEVKLAMRDAKERGVEQKLLFHKYDKENEDILKSWIKMGLEVRHYPDWGFHLIVYDGKKSILASNNPKNTEERSGMIIFSEGLSKALRDYFYSVWEKAIKVS